MEVWTTPRRMVPASLILLAHSLAATVASSATEPAAISLSYASASSATGSWSSAASSVEAEPAGVDAGASPQAASPSVATPAAAAPSTWRRSNMNSRVLLLMENPLPLEAIC